MRETKFKTKILSFGNNTGIEVPTKNLKELGTSRKPPVVVKIGNFEYTSTVAVMNGKNLISLSKANREKICIKGGDTVDVTLKLIEGTREVEIPEMLLKFLNKKKLMNSFNALSYSIRKEMVRKIVDAKKPETLEKRLIELENSLFLKKW